AAAHPSAAAERCSACSRWSRCAVSGVVQQRSHEVLVTRSLLFALLVASLGCTKAAATSSPDEPARRAFAASGDAVASTEDPAAWLDEAERALERGDPARAAALLARYL